jgi:protein SCO1/2
MRIAALAGLLLVATALAPFSVGPAFAKSKPKPAATAASAPAASPSFDKLGQGVDGITLTDTSGKQVAWSTLKGKPRVLFFGFTHCPVVCPVTVWELDAAMTEIGPKAADLKIDFVSLDPKRDTAPEMAKYFSGFKGRVHPLTGAEPDIARLAAAYEIKFQKVDTGKGDYTVDHTAIAFLIGADGKVRDTLAFGSPHELTVARLKALLGITPAG